MADDILLNQNIQLLTSAITALTRDMFNHTGGRSSLWGANTSVPGTSANKGNTEDKNTIKAIATNTLLNATMKSNTDTVKYLIKDSKKNMQDLGRYTQLSAQYFKTAIKDFSVKQLDVVLPKKLESFLQKTISKGIVPELKSYEDVVKLQKRASVSNIESALRLNNTFVTLDKSSKNYQAKLSYLLDEMNKTGFSMAELADAAKDHGKALKEHAGEVSRGIAEFTSNMHAAGDRWNNFTKVGEILAGVASVLGIDLYKAAIAAQKYGTEITSKTIPQAALAGMSAEELIKTQNENIQAIHSSGMTFDTFNQKLDDGASRLLMYTGSLKDGALLTANLFGTFRTLSDQGDQLENFQTEQEATFEKMNRTIGVTAEQFVALNEQLINNNDVQNSLYKLSAKERVGMVQSLVLQYAKLRADGLSEAQAMRLVDTFASINGKDTKTRFQESALSQGILGSFGFKNTAEFAALYRKGNRRDANENIRFTALTERYNKQLNEQYQKANYAGQMSIDARLEKLAPMGLFGAGTAGAATATSQGKEVHEQTAAILAQTTALDALGPKMRDIVLGIENVTQAIEAGFKPVIKAVGDIIGLMIGGNLFSEFKSILKARGAGAAVTEVGGAALGGAAAAATTAATAAIGVVTTAAVLSTIYAGVQALQGKDASNWISDWDKSSGGGIGDWMGAQLDKWGGIDNKAEKATSSYSVDQYRKSKIDKDNTNIAALALEPQTNATVTQIANLTEEVKKLTALQKQHIEETKKLTQVTQQGIAQQAAQTDDHINATKQIVEQKDTRRVSSSGAAG